MELKQQVTQKIDQLNENELKAVSKYLSFLISRSHSEKNFEFSEEELRSLYSEFKNEDRQLAESGMDEYNQQLKKEDNN